MVVWGGGHTHGSRPRCERGRWGPSRDAAEVTPPPPPPPHLPRSPGMLWSTEPPAPRDAACTGPPPPGCSGGWIPRRSRPPHRRKPLRPPPDCSRSRNSHPPACSLCRSFLPPLSPSPLPPRMLPQSAPPAPRDAPPATPRRPSAPALLPAPPHPRHFPAHRRPPHLGGWGGTRGGRAPRWFPALGGGADGESPGDVLCSLPPRHPAALCSCRAWRSPGRRQIAFPPSQTRSKPLPKPPGVRSPQPRVTKEVLIWGSLQVAWASVTGRAREQGFLCA